MSFGSRSAAPMSVTQRFGACGHRVARSIYRRVNAETRSEGEPSQIGKVASRMGSAIGFSRSLFDGSSRTARRTPDGMETRMDSRTGHRRAVDARS
jgi:hypothetical protein